MLSDRDIERAVDLGHIKISGYEPGMPAAQPASVDVHLGEGLRLMYNVGRVINPEDAETKEGLFGPSFFLLVPGDFVLATTEESISLNEEHAARLEGKSSLGRLGLLTHATAGFIDPGFRGQVTLELANIGKNPILLRVGMQIGQLCFFRLQSRANRPYGHADLGSHYQDQKGATESR